MRTYRLPSIGTMVPWDELDLEQAPAPNRQAPRNRGPEYARRTENRRAERITELMSIPFIGVDGEGGEVEDPQMVLFGPNSTRHEYLLLRAGDEVLETGEPLTWYECFRFLANLPAKANYVSYFFDYDVTMMIRGLTPERLHRLLRRDRPKDKRGWLLPLDVGPFQIDYLPGKEFKVRWRDGGDWIVIQDTGTFFQTAFIKTLDKWQVGTEEERRMIREGKALRSEFGRVTDEIRFYNALEVRLLSDLMGEFRSICKQLGYLPSRWEGPGLLATSALKRHKIPRSKNLEIMENGPLLNFARGAYYGGRFEIGTVGPTPPVDQWDINSAYPFCIMSLPCLVHGEWRHRDGKPGNLDRSNGLFCSRVTFGPKAPSHYYGLPIRDKSGNISFPDSGIGWYWSHELRTVLDNPYQWVEFMETWEYVSACDCRPFKFIEGVYNARKRLGKDQKGWVLKLLLNSLYGKMAQSIGTPAYSNPIWAGLITSHTRSILLQAIYSSENTSDIHMLATDGIFATSEALDLPVSEELGGWSKEEHPEGMFIIQPGLYFSEKDVKTPKTRGVPQRAVVEHRDEFIEAFRRVAVTGDGREGKVEIVLPTFLGAKACLHMDNLSMAGMWVEEKRGVTFDWSSKRSDRFRSQSALVQPLPYERPDFPESVPYSRLLGMDADLAVIELLRDLASEQPDWTPLTLL